MALDKKKTICTCIFENIEKGCVFNYETIHEQGKGIERINFSIQKDNTMIVRGYSMPKQNLYSFETIFQFQDVNRQELQSIVDTDLEQIPSLLDN